MRTAVPATTTRSAARLAAHGARRTFSRRLARARHDAQRILARLLVTPGSARR